jgi:hypothetical protein
MGIKYDSNKYNGITYKQYRKAYQRWKQAISRGHDVPLQLFLNSPMVKLHKAKPRAYYYAKCQLQLALATPKWVDVEAISNFYANRPEGYEVDHIEPINGELACGLHVPWNLQYLPATQNRKKSNK